MRSQNVIDYGKAKLRAFLQTPDGRAALTFLRSFTIEAVQGPDVTESVLRHHGGKCALVRQLENLANEEVKDDSDS